MSTAEGLGTLFTSGAHKDVLRSVVSFFSNKELAGITRVSQKFKELSQDSLIWRQKTVEDFGPRLAKGAKQPGKQWVQVHKDLKESQETRQAGLAHVLQTQVNKTRHRDIHQRTQRAAAALFGWNAPSPSTHYYPTGANSIFQGRVIKAFTSEPASGG